LSTRGTARISRYSPKSKLQRLPIETGFRKHQPINVRAAAAVWGPGVCIRLYSREDYEHREQYTPPEIPAFESGQCDLQTKILGLGQIEEFPFLEPPKSDSIKRRLQDAVRTGGPSMSHRELTPLGRKLARLPVDPRIARIIWAAHDENCLAEILIIASRARDTRSTRNDPLEKQQQADESHKRFADEDSDFLGELKLWDFYHQLKKRSFQRSIAQSLSSEFSILDPLTGMGRRACRTGGNRLRITVIQW